ncbi:MAG TPA: hypothetical protein VJV79_07760 [Polyangiaceae bacterium]|nr:hypothetical protein [Polyangiaceae bacterium]
MNLCAHAPARQYDWQHRIRHCSNNCDDGRRRGEIRPACHDELVFDLAMRPPPELNALRCHTFALRCHTFGGKATHALADEQLYFNSASTTAHPTCAGACGKVGEFASGLLQSFECAARAEANRASVA